MNHWIKKLSCQENGFTIQITFLSDILLNIYHILQGKVATKWPSWYGDPISFIDYFIQIFQSFKILYFSYNTNVFTFSTECLPDEFDILFGFHLV